MEDGIFVSNIKATIDEKELKCFFNQFGSVLDFNLQPDKFNDETKVCYIKFSSVDGATKSVKFADKSLHFGEPLRVSYKKYTERPPLKLSGIERVQSFGRGRGSILPTPGPPGFSTEVVCLKNLQLPIEKKFVVEVVELKSLSNILVRPLALTEKSRPYLISLLEQMNKNTDRLCAVKSVEVDQFYLAKWQDDDKFYRAKLLNKISDSKFKVCFVDEGTSGDIVTELRAIPQNLWTFPMQFLPCTVNCEDSPELIDMVLQEGASSEVSIYATSISKVSNNFLISIFLNGKNIIELFKEKYFKDPRKENNPNRRDVKTHILDSVLSNCTLAKDHHHVDQFVVTSHDSANLQPKLQPLNVCPIVNDLLVYRENDGTLHRCSIKSVNFEKDQVSYSVELLDDFQVLSTSKENLFKSPLEEINFPPKVIRGVPKKKMTVADGVPYKVKLTDYDCKKDLYVLEIVSAQKEAAPLTPGQSKTAIISHVESIDEFYAQLCDEDGLRTLEQLQVTINSPDYRLVRVGNERDLKVGDKVVAPFQGVNYRASVREIDSARNSVLLHFVDYGNCEWVDLAQVYRLVDVPLARAPPLARRCRLAGAALTTVPPAEAARFLREYCAHGEEEVQLRVVAGEPLEVDLVARNQRPFIDLLRSTMVTSDTVSNGDNIKAVIRKRIAALEAKVARLEMMSQ